MRNAGFAAILGVFAATSATSAAAATILVDVEPPGGIATETGAATLYEDVVTFSGELGAFEVEPNGPQGFVPRAHATEPGTLVLLGTGLLGVATLLRRRAS